MAAGLLLVCAAGCRKPEFTHRVAVLRFENLTADAGSEWIGRAVSEEIAGQLQGTRHNAVVSFAAIDRFNRRMGARPISAPGVSSEREPAIAAGANRLVTGFYTLREGTLRISTLQENLETHRLDEPLRFSGPLDDLLHLTDQIARAIDDEARPPITGSARALRSYAAGLESSGDQAMTLFEEAAGLDPDFGLPYVAMARMAIAGKNVDGFARIFAAVRMRGNGVRALDRAILNLQDAQLHAPLAARIDALAALARLEPADAEWLRGLGDAEVSANRYAEAADHYRRLATLLPNDVEPLNLLAYALMYSGDEGGSRKVFADYRRADPNDPNAFDSSGDGEFFFGRFVEAGKFYRAAYEKNPGLEGERIKEAWARLMTGDRIGTQRKSLPAAQLLRAAGDHARALEMIHDDPAAQAQLAWWKFLDGAGDAPSGAMHDAVEALLKKDYVHAAPLWRKLAEDSPPSEWWTRTVYARVLQESGQGTEAARYARFTGPPQWNRPVSLDELWLPWFLHQRTSSQR